MGAGAALTSPPLSPALFSTLLGTLSPISGAKENSSLRKPVWSGILQQGAVAGSTSRAGGGESSRPGTTRLQSTWSCFNLHGVGAQWSQVCFPLKAPRPLFSCVSGSSVPACSQAWNRYLEQLVHSVRDRSDRRSASSRSAAWQLCSIQWVT